MNLVRKVKAMPFRTLFAIFLLLALCVGVVAQSMRAAQLTQNADAREIEDTKIFVATDEVLDVSDVDEAKVKKEEAKKAAAKKAAKKKKARAKKKKAAKAVAAQAATPPKTERVSIEELKQQTIDVEKEFDTFIALTKKADQERTQSKKVSDETKEKIAATRDRIVAFCQQKIDKARLANRPDQISFYENVAKQITARAEAASSDTLTKETIDKAQPYTQAKNKAFNRILQQKKPADVTPRQKAYLEQRTLVILEESMQLFLSIINQVLSLINQATAIVNDPVSQGIGCALNAATRMASGGSALPPEVELLRALSSRLQTNMDDYRSIQDTLYVLTGRPPIKRKTGGNKNAKMNPMEMN